MAGGKTIIMSDKSDQTLPMEYSTPQEEKRYHHYTGNAIPWFVHLMWIGFWLLAITYSIKYVLTTIPSEMTNPP